MEATMAKSITSRLSTPKPTKPARKGAKAKAKATKPRKVANELSFLVMERNAYAQDAPQEYVYVRFYDAEAKMLDGSLREDDKGAQDLREAFKSDACKRVGPTGRTSKLRWSAKERAWKGQRDLFPTSVIEHCDAVQAMIDNGDITLK
jgi:hypothetical protein